MCIMSLSQCLRSCVSVGILSASTALMAEVVNVVKGLNVGLILQ